jgi:hypothetical protein
VRRHAHALRVLAALALSLPLACVARAEDVELFPELSVDLTAARYAPADTQFQWSGWIGAGAGVVRVGRVTLAGTADVETIIGNERRAFDANQANYHLAFGLRVQAGRAVVYPVLHHESRHLVDRPKTQAVDWNMLGVRVEGALPYGVPGSFQLGAARAVQRSYVDYEWEFLAAAHVPAVQWTHGELFLETEARFVTTTNRAPYFRDGFVDFTGAAGVRLRRDGRVLDLFAAYEHRNDVVLFEPDVRDRALFAFRIGLGRWWDVAAARSR